MDCLLAADQLVLCSLGATEEQIRVRVGVIADGMAPRVDLFCQFRTLADEFADQEERGLDVVSGKQVEQLRGDRRIRPVVKGERQFIRSSSLADGCAEQFRLRIYGTISRKSCEPG